MKIHNLIAAVDANLIGIPIVAADDATLQNAINATFFVVGAVTVLFILIGAIRYIISTGDSNSTKRAKDTIVYAVIGLVVTIISFLIVQLILYAVNA